MSLTPREQPQTAAAAAAAARRPSASGSLAASYAGHAHDEAEALASLPRGQQPDESEREYNVRLPIDAGVPHSTLNLTHGIVVDPAAKKLAKFENEKYLRSHPELGQLIQSFVVHVLETRPENIEKAAIDFFVHQNDQAVKKQ